MKSFVFLLLAILTANITYSQPGTVDIAFGNHGFVYDSGISVHYAVAQQKDGELITTGGYDDLEFNSEESLIRYLQTGSIDSTFGINGFASGNGAYDMIVQPDDKILIVSTTYDKNGVQSYYVGRYQPNGTLDSSFGNNGITLIPNFNDFTQFNKIRQAPDGSIIIGGGGTSADRQTPYTMISHVSADGMFDSKFGGNGRVLNYNAAFNARIAIQNDGKILLTGNTFGGGFDQQDFALSRYNSDGATDESFGTNGTVITQGVQGLTGHDAPGGIVVQPDGKIVIGGISAGYNFVTYMAALRYNAEGTLDKSFGTNGRAFVSFEGKTPLVTTVLLQQDGKLILTGSASDFSESNFAICRLNADGTSDSSFAIDGKNLTPFSKGGVAAYCALLQQDGKIVQGGSYYNNNNSNNSYLLVRYNGDKKQLLLARIKSFLHNHGIGWQGLVDNNIRYYSVQYSETGRNFTGIEKVSGAGSNSFQQYNFNISDAGYYRIVAVDRKGYKTFSNKVLIREADIASTASVFPNPAIDYITVQGLNINETANISIADGSGNVKLRGVSNGGEQYRAQLNNMLPGTYYVNITTGYKTEVLKFVKR